VDPTQRFGEYAAAFERVYQSDEWSDLEPYFTEDAVYEVQGGPPFGGKFEGRTAVLAHLERSVNAFDRRFPARKLLMLEGPTLRQGRVWMRWRVTYAGPGLPELVLDGEEAALFAGDRIQRLEDRFPPEASPILEMWLRSFGGRLRAPKGG